MGGRPRRLAGTGSSPRPSPLARCADFARALARRRSIPLEVNEDLREMHFGTWEGRTAAELMERYPEALSRFWRDPLNHPSPGAEPLARLRARTLAASRAIRSSTSY
ncbi:MAG: histidine phosphatase family protein [Gammaproteobacteria bacterium]